MWDCKKCSAQVEDSFDICWNCGTSKDGVEDPSFERADEGAAEAAESSQRPSPAVQLLAEQSGQPTASCPGCGSESLDFGYMSAETRFFRSNQWLSAGWPLQAFVCLDCGLLTQYVSPDGLEQLRARNS